MAPAPNRKTFVRSILLSLLGGAACALLLGEGGSSRVAGAACPEWGSGRALGASFSGDASLDAQVGAFVQAAYDIAQVVQRARADVVGACRSMGRDLQVPPEQMNGDDPRRVCGAVGARIDEILRAGVRVHVRAVPPSCRVDANLEAQCQGRCSARLEPAQVIARCEPGKLAGTCRGTCSGRCEGTCSGTCNGTCAATDNRGRCKGACEGECRGTCSGTCHASCEGTWEAPRCEGKLKGPKAEANCHAACRARADAKARCTPGRVDVAATGAAQAQALTATLRANLPALLAAQYRLARQLRGDVLALKDAGASLRGRLQGAGSHAAACVAAAVNAVAEASVSVSITVEASASVSGRVGA